MQNHYQAIKAAVWALPIVAAISCQQKESPTQDKTPVNVTTETVRLVSVADRFSVSGNIEGMKTVKLSFQVAGRIEGISGEEGSFVKRGTTVAWLEQANYAIAKELADVQMAQAADEYRRIALLHERGSVSESDYVKCKFALDGATCGQKLRAKDLADTKLVSPIDGILLQKFGEAGEMVAAGMPVLTVSDISTVKVNAYIPEHRLGDIRIGQKVEIAIAAINAVRQGTVVEVGGMADPASRAFTIKAVMDNPGYAIRPGMIAEAYFQTADSVKAITVSAGALQRTPDGQPYVYVADTVRGQAFRRNVSLGAVRAGRIEIASGLEAGERVVAGGGQKLSNGCRIRIIK